MSETQGLRMLGLIILLIGVVGLLVGIAMPTTSTHTSKTCVDSFTGYGKDCVTGSITTANPMKGPVIGTGVLGILGGIGILAMGSDSSSAQERENRKTTNGGFADKLRDYQGGSDDVSDTVGNSEE